MSTVEGRMVAAYQAGHDAATGKQRRNNPHDGLSPVTETRVLSVMWARGYSAGNPVDLDAELPPVE